MDIDSSLANLRRELERVNRAILILENITTPEIPMPKSNRGRKSMGHEERVAVSERMKRYWSGRRSGAKQANTETMPNDARL